MPQTAPACTMPEERLHVEVALQLTLNDQSLVLRHPRDHLSHQYWSQFRACTECPTLSQTVSNLVPMYPTMGRDLGDRHLPLPATTDVAQGSPLLVVPGLQLPPPPEHTSSLALHVSLIALHQPLAIRHDLDVKPPLH